MAEVAGSLSAALRPGNCRGGSLWYDSIDSSIKGFDDDSEVTSIESIFQHEWRNMPEEKKLLVSLDRIEEEIAVLVTPDGHMWLLPAAYLPEDSREGDVLDVILRRNPAETAKLAGRVRDLQQRLLERTRERNENQDQ